MGRPEARLFSCSPPTPVGAGTCDLTNRRRWRSTWSVANLDPGIYEILVQEWHLKTGCDWPSHLVPAQDCRSLNFTLDQSAWSRLAPLPLMTPVGGAR